MTSARPERTLAIALHDVAPPFEREIRFQLDRLASIGDLRCVLHVVPNWHGRYPLNKYPDFVRLLGERMRGGDEIVLHGLSHSTEGLHHARGEPVSRARARLFAPGTAEFLERSPDDAVEAVVRGLNELRGLGIGPITGFCPPGWLISAANRHALAVTGLQYASGMFGIQDLSTGRWRRFPSLGYMGAGPRQELGVSLMNAGILRSFGHQSSFLAVYLHPQIGPNSRALQRVLSIINWLVRGQGRQTQTFEEWHGAR